MSLHGIRVKKVPTGVTPPVESLAGFPIYTGTAPIHMSADRKAKLNEPVLVANLAEATAAMGFLDSEGTAGQKKFKFSLCEPISAHFKIGNVGPIVLINVLDPATHKTAHAAESHTLGADGTATLTRDHAWPDSVVVKVAAATKTLGTDYTFTVDSAGKGVVARVSTGSIAAGATILVDYDELNPSAVDDADIIGGVDAETQKKTGLELVSEVFPRFQKVPGQILAPGYSSTVTVAAVMRAKAAEINGNFGAMALTDIPTGTVKVYTGCAAWKSTNSFTGKDEIVCWPLGKLGDTLYHLSTLTAVRCMTTDADKGGVPSESPSNKTLPINGLALDDGSEVVLDITAANALNDQGITTAINFSGWKLWGNRTAAYPGSTDPADTFINFARIYLWKKAGLVLAHMQRVDSPTNRRQIEGVVDSENITLNALAASGDLIGGRVDFMSEDNPVTELLNGQCTYAFGWMPPPPMQGLNFKIEVKPTYLANLFS